MNRLSRLLVVALATLSICGRDVCVANETFELNNSAEGWTPGVLLPPSGTDTPYWEWEGAPSKPYEALRALLIVSDSAAGAYMISPCLKINSSGPKGEIDVDFSHKTLFPEPILGQVQYQVTTATGTSDWMGIPSARWLLDGDHVIPTGTNVFPPLVYSPGSGYYDPSNLWPAFSGTNVGTGQGDHTKSAFYLTYGGTGTDLGIGVQEGDEIQFRFVVGIDTAISGTTISGTTPALLWEVNNVNVKGVTLCEVPEPGTLALAGGAALVGLAAARRSRSRPSRRRGTAWRHPG